MNIILLLSLLKQTVQQVELLLLNTSRKIQDIIFANIESDRRVDFTFTEM